MPRLPIKPIRALPWYLRPFFWNQRRKYGAVLDSALLWARAPKLFLGVAFLYGMIDRRKSSPIDPALRSLVTVRVSQLNGCRFCVDLNAATLLRRGVDMSKVEALETWRQSNLFSEKERVALDYAEAVTLRSDQVDDELMKRLKGQFSDDAIVETHRAHRIPKSLEQNSTALSACPRKGSVRSRGAGVKHRSKAWP